MRKLLLILTLVLPYSAFADTSANDGRALPSQGTQVGGKGADGFFHFLLVNNDGSLNLAGGSSGVVAQGSTTSGESGMLTQGAVVAGDQTYTAGQTSPVTLTPAGQLKVILASSGSVTGGATGTTSNLVGGIYNTTPPTLTNGQQAGVQLNVNGALKTDNSGNTQPISAASLPLPTSAATSTKQSDGTQKTQVVNAAGTEVYTGTLVNSVAYEASHVLKASAGALVSLVGYNSKTSAQFVQVFNSATVPADTAVPVLTFTVPASSNFSFDVPITGLPLSTGIAVSNSSTGPTKTIGSADCYFTAVVR